MDSKNRWRTASVSCIILCSTLILLGTLVPKPAMAQFTVTNSSNNDTLLIVTPDGSTGGAGIHGYIVANGLALSGNNDKRGAIWFSTPGDFNLALYNNNSNIDGENSWDGTKWNVLSGLNIRVGSGTYRTAMYIEGGDESRMGDVGIGTASPDRKLHVLSSGSGDGIKVEGSSSPTIYLNNSGSSKEWAMFVEDGSGNFIISDGVTQRLFVNSDGYLGIGVTAPDNRLTLPNNADASGQGLANAWATYSSRRWKTNIKPIEGALEKVQHLRGVSFDWKASGKHDIGLIAEEVGKVLPEVVTYEKNGRDAKSVDYARLVSVLIEGLKEQSRIVHGQNLELTELRARISKLELALQKIDLAAAVHGNVSGVTGR
jgi:hypothetical protein